MPNRGVGANLIADARRLRGATQEALAARAGTSQAAIAAYEAGIRDPSVETLIRILAAAGFRLRVHLEEISERGSRRKARPPAGHIKQQALWFASDTSDDDRLRQQLALPPEERIRRMLRARPRISAR
jgi:transcriptional regulator with XRE-family HTH domain